MTPFRGPQAALVLRGAILTLAPHVQSLTALREAVFELARDSALWAQLDLEREPLPPMRKATLPEGANGLGR